MTHTLYPDDGHLFLMDGSRTVWSTEQRPINLLPEEDWISASVSIEYPDLQKYNMYFFEMAEGSPDVDRCASWATVIGEERGPGSGGGLCLARELLGTVPEGVNALEVYANLTRTTSPGMVDSRSVPSLVPAGQVFLPGGSCIVERAPSNIWTRGFQVTLDGTNIYLDRYQSVKHDVGAIPWKANNEWNVVPALAGGYTYSNLGGNSNMGASGKGRNGQLLQLIDGKGVGGTLYKHRSGANPCSRTFNTSYASTFAGSLIIRPGYVGTGVNEAVLSKVRFCGHDSQVPGGNTATFDPLWVCWDYTVIAVTANKFGGPIGISSVSVNGTPATQLVNYANNSWTVAGNIVAATVAAVFIIPTPSNNRADVVVTTTGSPGGVEITAYGVRGLNSIVPTATIQGNSVSTTNLATQSGGVAIFVGGSGHSNNVLTLNGLANLITFRVVAINTSGGVSGGGGGSGAWWRHLVDGQNTDGSPIALSPTAVPGISGTGTSGFAWVGVALR